MEIQRRNYEETVRSISELLAARDCAVSGRLECDRRTRKPGKEGTMRQVTRMHRTLTVLAVGLLALAAPLVASATNGGPGPG
jgi:hypothetical protein